jgi:YD repeat-containing protein
MESIRDQLNFATTYAYDAAGRRQTRRFANGDPTTYSHDAVGRQTVAHYADGTRVTFGYDALGSRTTMQDSTGTTTYAYDAASRMTGKTDPGSLVQGYEYDAANQRTKLVDPDGGIRTFQYDQNGRLTWLAAPGALFQPAYDPAGRRTTLLNGLSFEQTLWTYDAASQIVSLLVEMTEDPGPRLRFTYSYDEVGNRRTVHDLNGSLTTYGYDAKNRLTQDHTTGFNTHTYDYSYDANDNRLTSNETGSVVSWTYDAANRITTSQSDLGQETYGYDPNGNLTSVLGILFNVEMFYDKENRLIRHAQDEVEDSIFTYDGDGLKRTENDGTAEVTTLVWDGSDYLQGRS